VITALILILTRSTETVEVFVGKCIDELTTPQLKLELERALDMGELQYALAIVWELGNSFQQSEVTKLQTEWDVLAAQVRKLASKV
jgi:hypothetical protein